MSAKDVVEYYRQGGGLVAAVRSVMVPPVGALINIRKKTWRVVGVTYCLDDADGQNERMRANVDLAEHPQ